MKNTRISIQESFVQGKVDQDHCEDTIVETADFVAIVDGVTSKSAFRYQGQTTGKIASKLVAEVLKSCPSRATILEFISLVNKRFARFYQEVDFPYDRQSQGLQAVAVIYSRFQNEVWQIGDAQVNIDHKLHLNPKKSDLVLSDFRSLVLTSSDDTPEISKPDPGRQLILPWILKATQFANQADSEWGYAILNGDPIPESLLRVYGVDLRLGGGFIALASDGYPALKEPFLEDAESDLKRVLKNDPMCYKQYRSTKGLVAGNQSFDDRSFISFKIEKLS
ncbi:hypothetical protein [Secundilactobacillus folii]|uniref:Protein phosphatase 2C n=1 Tax=Secundilactobacillus folii TaxID=2678357 RepID=A0A7X3C1A1_9LACO|nr:hypothetical protein [Secundilactobacillus folii]MTV81510.1 hypothetical protein [Secundilactobacillus folii]